MSDLVAVGRVGRPHGVKGAFVVEGASADPERFRTGTRLLAGAELVEVVEAKHAGGRVVVRLDRAVERGVTLAVPRAALPQPEQDAYYVFELVGMAVEEEGGRTLGNVTGVTPAPANDVLELDSGLALPLVDACVREIDRAGGRIRVAPGFSDPVNA